MNAAAFRSTASQLSQTVPPSTLSLGPMHLCRRFQSTEAGDVTQADQADPNDVVCISPPTQGMNGSLIAG